MLPLSLAVSEVLLVKILARVVGLPFVLHGLHEGGEWGDIRHG